MVFTVGIFRNDTREMPYNLKIYIRHRHTNYMLSEIVILNNEIIFGIARLFDGSSRNYIVLDCERVFNEREINNTTNIRVRIFENGIYNYYNITGTDTTRINNDGIIIFIVA